MQAEQDRAGAFVAIEDRPASMLELASRRAPGTDDPHGPTAELVSIVLRDSAKLQEEDARYAAGRGFSKHRRPKPLYDLDDVERTLPLFTVVDFDTEVDVADGISARLPTAGHILGSTSPVVTVNGALPWGREG